MEEADKENESAVTQRRGWKRVLVTVAAQRKDPVVLPETAWGRLAGEHDIGAGLGGQLDGYQAEKGLPRQRISLTQSFEGTPEVPFWLLQQLVI